MDFGSLYLQLDQRREAIDGLCQVASDRIAARRTTWTQQAVVLQPNRDKLADQIACSNQAAEARNSEMLANVTNLVDVLGSTKRDRTFDAKLRAVGFARPVPHQSLTDVGVRAKSDLPKFVERCQTELQVRPLQSRQTYVPVHPTPRLPSERPGPAINTRGYETYTKLCSFEREMLGDLGMLRDFRKQLYTAPASTSQEWHPGRLISDLRASLVSEPYQPDTPGRSTAQSTQVAQPAWIVAQPYVQSRDLVHKVAQRPSFIGECNPAERAMASDAPMRHTFAEHPIGLGLRENILPPSAREGNLAAKEGRPLDSWEFSRSGPVPGLSPSTNICEDVEQQTVYNRVSGSPRSAERRPTSARSANSCAVRVAKEDNIPSASSNDVAAVDVAEVANIPAASTNSLSAASRAEWDCAPACPSDNATPVRGAKEGDILSASKCDPAAAGAIAEDNAPAAHSPNLGEARVGEDDVSSFNGDTLGATGAAQEDYAPPARSDNAAPVRSAGEENNPCAGWADPAAGVLVGGDTLTPARVDNSDCASAPGEDNVVAANVNNSAASAEADGDNAPSPRSEIPGSAIGAEIDDIPTDRSDKSGAVGVCGGGNAPADRIDNSVVASEVTGADEVASSVGSDSVGALLAAQERPCVAARSDSSSDGDADLEPGSCSDSSGSSIVGRRGDLGALLGFSDESPAAARKPSSFKGDPRPLASYGGQRPSNVLSAKVDKSPSSSIPSSKIEKPPLQIGVKSAPTTVNPISSSPVVESARVNPISSSPVIEPAKVDPISSSPVIEPAKVNPISSSPVVEPAKINPSSSSPVVESTRINPISSSPVVEPPKVVEPTRASPVASSSVADKPREKVPPISTHALSSAVSNPISVASHLRASSGVSRAPSSASKATEEMESALWAEMDSSLSSSRLPTDDKPTGATPGIRPKLKSNPLRKTGLVMGGMMQDAASLRQKSSVDDFKPSFSLLSSHVMRPKQQASTMKMDFAKGKFPEDS